MPVQVPDAPVAPMLQSLLNRLAVGPTDRERARGLVTDLGPASTIVLRNVSGGTASIDLQSNSQDPSASKLPVAVGQIVMTATSIVGVDRVVFVRDGTVLPVPGPDGSIDRGCPRRGRLRRHDGPRPATRRPNRAAAAGGDTGDHDDDHGALTRVLPPHHLDARGATGRGSSATG